MWRGKGDEEVHAVLVAFQVLQSLSSEDSSKRVADEVDAFILVERVDEVQSYFLCH